MNKKILTLTIIIACTVMVALFCGPAMAKVTGLCSNCHTMHSSQESSGADTAVWTAKGWDGTPKGSLLVGDCIGCHTGTNTGSNVIPYVSATDADYGTDGTDGTTLAGGTFRYVAGDSAKGHNVEGVAAAYEMDPPGLPGTARVTGRPTSWGSEEQLTCAGTYGCHGDPEEAGSAAGIAGAHHGTAGFGDDYRWLKGIGGLEWNTDGATGGKCEFEPAADKHNQYKGADRTTEAVASIDATTISSLCGQCHGDFHAGDDISEGTWGSAWKRHPTDFDMAEATGSEYAYYNGDDGADTAAYSVSAPVASANVGSVLSVVTVTGTGNDTAIVMCLSCHRAHGTTNDDLLRWEYTMYAGDSGHASAGKGCFICHTTKDDT